MSEGFVATSDLYCDRINKNFTSKNFTSKNFTPKNQTSTQPESSGTIWCWKKMNSKKNWFMSSMNLICQTILFFLSFRFHSLRAFRIRIKIARTVWTVRTVWTFWFGTFWFRTFNNNFWLLAFSSLACYGVAFDGTL